MTDFSKEPIMLNELLPQLEKNEIACTSLLLASEQFNYANETNKYQFFRLLRKNTTLTNLSLIGNTIDASFSKSLILVLEDNRTLTSLDYDKYDVPAGDNNTIQKYLERNRKLAIEKPIPLLTPVSLRKIARWNKPLRAFEAIEQGNLALLNSLILKNKSLLLAVNDQGLSLLAYAAGRGQIASVKLLIELGADINFDHEQTGTALYVATASNRIAIVQLLLDRGANITCLKNGSQTLHAVRDPEITTRLIAYGAQVNALIADTPQTQSSKGYSVLHCAMQYSNPDLLKVLIENGADVNSIGFDGNTPAHILVSNYSYATLINPMTERRFMDCLNLLVAAKADLLIKNAEGLAPLDVAEELQFLWYDVIEKYTNEQAKITESLESASFKLPIAKAPAVAKISPLTPKNATNPNCIFNRKRTSDFVAMDTVVIDREETANKKHAGHP